MRNHDSLAEDLPIRGSEHRIFPSQRRFGQPVSFPNLLLHRANLMVQKKDLCHWVPVALAIILSSHSLREYKRKDSAFLSESSESFLNVGNERSFSGTRTSIPRSRLPFLTRSRNFGKLTGCKTCSNYSQIGPVAVPICDLERLGLGLCPGGLCPGWTRTLTRTLLRLGSDPVTDWVILAATTS